MVTGTSVILLMDNTFLRK